MLHNFKIVFLLRIFRRISNSPIKQLQGIIPKNQVSSKNRMLNVTHKLFPPDFFTNFTHKWHFLSLNIFDYLQDPKIGSYDETWLKSQGEMN